MTAKQDRGRQTIRSLLDAALDIFADEGVEGFTITSVVNRSGVSVGSLYHHFGSFDGLSTALYAQCTAEVMDTMIDTMHRASTARTGIEAMARSYLRWSRDHRPKSLVLHTARESEYRPAVTEVKRSRLGEIEKWLMPHIEAGRVQALSPVVIELLTMGPLAMTVGRWLENMPGIDLDEAIAVMPECIWSSVKGPVG